VEEGILSCICGQAFSATLLHMHTQDHASARTAADSSRHMADRTASGAEFSLPDLNGKPRSCGSSAMTFAAQLWRRLHRFRASSENPQSTSVNAGASHVTVLAVNVMSRAS